MMGFGSRYDPVYPPAPPRGREYDRGGYDPRPPYGYDPRFDDFQSPSGGSGYGPRGPADYPSQGQQNQLMSAQNQKKAAKLGAKGAGFLAKFGLGKLTENVDMGGYEDHVNNFGEKGLDELGDRIDDRIDRADFGEFDYGRGPPGRAGSRHVGDVMERRARELSPDRAPAGYRLDHERPRQAQGLPRSLPDPAPRDYDRRSSPNDFRQGPPDMGAGPHDYDQRAPEDLSRNRRRPQDYADGPRDFDGTNPRNFDRRPSPETNQGPRLTGPHDNLDEESRFGDVAYKDVPADVRRVYEKKLREKSQEESKQDVPKVPKLPSNQEGGGFDDNRRRSRKGPSEDDRTYFMYPQGFAIKPGKFSSPPSYASRDPAIRQPTELGPDHVYPAAGPPNPWERDNPANHLGKYRSY